VKKSLHENLVETPTQKTPLTSLNLMDFVLGIGNVMAKKKLVHKSAQPTDTQILNI
jgi:hypothetical protein